MSRKKKIEIPPTKFSRVYEIEVGNFIIKPGDVFKIHGEHGLKFQFHSFVTNTETGVQWVDCFELEKGIPRIWRSFALDRVRRIPEKRKRKYVSTK
jgi:hypothetical protein